MNDNGMLTYNINVLLDLLTHPAGVASLAVVLCMFVASVWFPNTRWLFLSGLLFITTMPAADAATFTAPLAPPFQQLREYRRPLIYLLILLLSPTLVTSTRGWRRQLITPALLMFFLFEISIGFRLIVLGNNVVGVVSVFSYAMIFAILGVGLSSALKSTDDVYKVLWAASCSGALVVIGTGWQFAVNRNIVVTNNRLSGLTGNAQQFALVLMYSLPATCYLLTRPAGRTWVRPLLAVQVALTSIFLMWTGSRMGALSTSAGLLVLFHRKMGRLVIAGAVVLVLILFLFPYFEGSAESSTRLFSTLNTRQGVWQNLTNKFLENPWFGVPSQSLESQESSYLSSLACFGVIGSLPLFSAIVLLTLQLIRLQRMRAYFQTQAGLIDVICAFWMVAAVGAVFEAVLLGIMSNTIIMVYVFAACTALLVDCAKEEAAANDLAYLPDGSFVPA